MPRLPTNSSAGIFSITTHSNPELDNKSAASILFKGTTTTVSACKLDSHPNIKQYMSSYFPNVVLVKNWVMRYELDNIKLFNQQSGATYTSNKDEP